MKLIPGRTSVLYAGTGVLATLAGMAAGHLTAAFLNPASSPVLAVGSTVIDLTPTPLKEYAVREFGTKDKPILIGSVVIVTLVLAAIAGVLARRWFPVGAGLLLTLVATAGAAAMFRPVAETVDLVPAIVAAVVGLGALVVGAGFLRAGNTALHRPLHSLRSERSTRPAPDAPSAASAASAEDTLAGQAHGGSPAVMRESDDTLHDGSVHEGPSRRGILIGTGVMAGVALAMAGAGQWVTHLRTRIGNINLPAAAKAIAPLPEGLEKKYDGITQFRTPNDKFYRVDTNLTVPVVPVDDWKLTIDGDVDKSFSLSFDDLMEMDLIERDITMTCVSNDVGGRYVGGARWLGVPLKDLFALAGVGSKADQILSTAVDGFTISTPLQVAMDGRDSMVAIGMNGEPLPAEHGFPARLITPGIYGFVGATKWLEKLTLTTYEKETAYWTERDWATDAPIKIASRVDIPKGLSTVKAGESIIGGVAWAQRRGIGKVEVSVDGGKWTEANLGPDAGVDYWRQWYLPWDFAKGAHMIAVRATDENGEVQTAARAKPFPEGSSGLQEIVVTAD